MHAQRGLKLILSVLLLTQPLFALAQESIKPGFDPGMLIQDDRFGDSQTFGGPEGVQRFLESKRSPLADTSPAFLARLGEPASLEVKQTLGDVNAQLARKRTAAELIWDA